MNNSNQKHRQIKASIQVRLQDSLKNCCEITDTEINELSEMLLDDLLTITKASRKKKRLTNGQGRLRKLVVVSRDAIGINRTKQLFHEFASQNGGQSIYFPKIENMDKMLN